MSKTANVLLVDDDEDDYLIIRNLLAKVPNSPFKLDWEKDIGAAKAVIAAGKHDIYLIDYRLGSENGLELLSHFDLVQRTEPFIILTGAGDENVESKAMNMGVADYLVKGSLDTELLSRVLRYSQQRKHIEAQRVQQLIEINRSKDEFIALASHQLRTPATAVKQYVGMVLEGYAGEVSEEQKRFLQSAYESNERQLQVVNDILRVAKLDLKKITLKLETVNVVKLMQSILHDSASQLANRDQDISLIVPKSPLVSQIDSEYIRMALGNIVDNASKYTPHGKLITIKVARKKYNKIVITVQDEGVGIEEEDLGKLFKKFSRIDNPLSVKVGGTGLGLYWSKEIIQLHGGRIDVESAPGKGSVFSVTLPESVKEGVPLYLAVV